MLSVVCLTISPLLFILSFAHKCWRGSDTCFISATTDSLTTDWRNPQMVSRNHRPEAEGEPGHETGRWGKLTLEKVLLNFFCISIFFVDLNEVLRSFTSWTMHWSNAIGWKNKVSREISYALWMTIRKQNNKRRTTVTSKVAYQEAVCVSRIYLERQKHFLRKVFFFAVGTIQDLP